MNIIDWDALDEAARAAALARPALAAGTELASAVRRIIEQVRADGDSTLRALTRRYDGVELGELAVGKAEFDAAEAALSEELKAAIDRSIERLARFHAAGMPGELRVETAPGVVCERIHRPIEQVGLYVPAGSAPLPSTAMMLGVPARLAACPGIVICTPPRREDGRADPAVLYVARRLGIGPVFKLGGAQAIAALAFGTESVPRCDKIFGPGNAWVTEAKLQVAQAPGGPAIDLPAGPSEVLVIADAGAEPELVAADLLSQAEHGPDSQVVLLSESRALLETVLREIEAQLARLPRAAIARQALQASRLIRVTTLEQAVEVSNRYAPEHLILQTAEPRRLLPLVRAAGSIFVGRNTPESAGDYSSGTNHVLPTYGHARAWSGVSVASFLKAITVQELSADGLAGIAADIVALARAEGLEAHAQAVLRRLGSRVS